MAHYDYHQVQELVREFRRAVAQNIELTSELEMARGEIARWKKSHKKLSGQCGAAQRRVNELERSQSAIHEAWREIRMLLEACDPPIGQDRDEWEARLADVQRDVLAACEYKDPGGTKAEVPDDESLRFYPVLRK